LFAHARLTWPPSRSTRDAQPAAAIPPKGRRTGT
jgi:hypothetical protein